MRASVVASIGFLKDTRDLSPLGDNINGRRTSIHTRPTKITKTAQITKSRRRMIHTLNMFLRKMKIADIELPKILPKVRFDPPKT